MILNKGPVFLLTLDGDVIGCIMFVKSHYVLYMYVALTYVDVRCTVRINICAILKTTSAKIENCRKRVPQLF